MAQVNAEHVPLLSSSFVGVLVITLLLLGAVNHLADK